MQSEKGICGEHGRMRQIQQSSLSILLSLSTQCKKYPSFIFLFDTIPFTLPFSASRLSPQSNQPPLSTSNQTILSHPLNTINLITSHSALPSLIFLYTIDFFNYSTNIPHHLFRQPDFTTLIPPLNDTTCTRKEGKRGGLFHKHTLCLKATSEGG